MAKEFAIVPYTLINVAGFGCSCTRILYASVHVCYLLHMLCIRIDARGRFPVRGSR